MSRFKYMKKGQTLVALFGRSRTHLTALDVVVVAVGPVVVK